MRRLDVRVASAALVCLAMVGEAPAAPQEPLFGKRLEPADIAQQYSVPPSGAGLPKGSGTVAAGSEVFAGQCAAFHGDKLQGVKAAGGPALIGGRGTLASKKPVKTVESNWPYATTLFDYVRRAMPFNAPGSLTDDQVYAVVAYVLAQDKIITPDATLDATSLPKVHMPNANGFVPDPRPGAPEVLRNR